MAQGFDYNRQGIFIGIVGLRWDINIDTYKIQLKYLFKELCNTDVTESQITITYNSDTRNCSAFVYIQDENTAKEVFKILGEHATRAAFSNIKDPNKQLKFDYQKTQIQPVTSTYGTPTANSAKPAQSTLQNTNRQIEQYYHLNDQIGNETRTREFKQGGFLSVRIILQNTIGKYVCAFLNTEGGTLLVGVDDHGRVVGVTCDQQMEDRHRRTIDNAIASIRPLVPPNLYTVQFVGILDRNNSPIRNQKILEVEVSQDDSEVYMYGNEAFIRRDGSVQKLSDSDVQQLRRKKRDEKNKVQHKLDKHGEQLDALEKQIATTSGVQQKLDKHGEHLVALEEQIATTSGVQQKLDDNEKELQKQRAATAEVQKKLDENEKELQEQRAATAEVQKKLDENEKALQEQRAATAVVLKKVDTLEEKGKKKSRICSIQ